MELRAARAAARRRGATWQTSQQPAQRSLVDAAALARDALAAAGPAAARVAAGDPAPVLLLAALVLAAELMSLELGRPGTRNSTTMSQPFAVALVLGWGTAAGVVALGICQNRPGAARAEALIRQLRESERRKCDLLATVSHELKAPLTVILGTLGTLSRRGTVLEPAERREFVDMAVRRGTRLKELIEQLLLAADPTPPARAPAPSSACP